MSSSSLPPEVLGEIFVACLPERDSDRLRLHRVPMLVSQVSSDWRKVALEEPCLWDTIIFSPSSFKQDSKFIHGGGIERWFDRTGRIWPLSFGDEPSEAPSGSHIIQCLPIILRYARRFKHLSLVMTKIMHFETIRRGFPQDVFDQLESISLCCSMEMCSYALQTFPRLITPLKTASRLGHVSFTLLRADPDKFALPWAQLTSIEVASRKRHLGVGEWRNLFGMCYNLRRGTFVFPRWGGPSAKAPLVHASLESLTPIVSLSQPEAVVYGTRAPDYDFAHLLSAVTFPNIQRLRFEFEARRKRVYNVPSVCHTMQPSLKTVIFGWRGDANREAPREASEFIDSLTREPGAFNSLRHMVLSWKSNKLDHIVTVLRSRPHLSVTVTAVPKRINGWMRAMEGHEDSNTIKDRIGILSTENYYRLNKGN